MSAPADAAGAAAGEFEFDADTRLSGEGPAFKASLGDRWNGMAGLNPSPSECRGFPAGGVPGVPIADRVEYRMATAPGWLSGQPSGNPAQEFWLRFRDGREPDLAALPLLVDAAAPAVLEVGALSTTVELTVHLRARPAPGWLACRVLTRFVTGGYHEEDFEVWDSAGALVAQSRQLALVLG